MSDKNQTNLWSGDVKTKWHPPAGFFERKPQEIAEGLKAASDSHAQAMDRLNFYINRAGSNLSEEDRERLETAKDILEDLYEEED